MRRAPDSVHRYVSASLTLSPMTLLDLATDLQQQAAGPGIFDALDTYYADDVTIVEGTGETFHGKETQRGRIQEFLSTLTEMHDGGIGALAVNETAPGTGVALVETWSDMTMADGTRARMEEVAVQQWADGKVVHERFYYNAPGA